MNLTIEECEEEEEEEVWDNLSWYAINEVRIEETRRQIAQINEDLERLIQKERELQREKEDMIESIVAQSVKSFGRRRTPQD